MPLSLTLAFRDVLAWNRKVGLKVRETPYEYKGLGPASVSGLAVVDEEIAELHEAIQARNTPAIADGIADLIFAAMSYAVAEGIDLAPIWDEVVRANMTKLPGNTRGDGKVLKPDGFVPPDHGFDMIDQRPLTALYPP